MRLLHLSDPHMGTEQVPVTDALVDLAHRLAPDALLISGDLTQRATPAQFARAEWLLAQLPQVPRLVIPGNHDIALWNLWQRLWQPYTAYERLVGERGPQGVSRLDLPGVRVVAVDTTRWWRHRHGTLSPTQVQAAAQQLRTAPAGTWRIIMTHHPLAVQLRSDREDRPWGHRRALRAWQEAGVDLLVAGHLHNPGVIQVGPAAWVAQSGTCVSHRLPPGVHNSVQLLRTTAPDATGGAPQRACIRYDYDRSAGQFLQSHCHPLRPASVPANLSLPETGGCQQACPHCPDPA